MGHGGEREEFVLANLERVIVGAIVGGQRGTVRWAKRATPVPHVDIAARLSKYD